MDLFSSSASQKDQHLQFPNADISYFPDFLSTEQAEHYFNILNEKIAWQQDDIKIFGKIYKQPRLTALYGEKGKSYTYSNITMHPKPFTMPLLEIKNRIEQACDATYNVVLLNLYRDGNDSNGWHSDDEKELGDKPVIASVSLGAKRKFQLRNKKDKTIRRTIELTPGSLLLMKGVTQHFFFFFIPKTKKNVGSRINLTFRKIN